MRKAPIGMFVRSQQVENYSQQKKTSNRIEVRAEVFRECFSVFRLRDLLPVARTPWMKARLKRHVLKPCRRSHVLHFADAFSFFPLRRAARLPGDFLDLNLPDHGERTANLELNVVSDRAVPRSMAPEDRFKSLAPLLFIRDRMGLPCDDRRGKVDRIPLRQRRGLGR